MSDSWSVYLTLYRKDPCWTCDLCICHYTEWKHVGLVICVSDILQNDAMLDSSSVYLKFYRMTPCWTHDLCIWHCTEWCHVGLVICIWHYTWWRNVGLVTYVSDIIQNDVGLVICISDIYRMTPRWTCDLCIWHYTGWCNVQHGVILYNVRYRSRVQHGSILYNVRYTDHDSDMPSFCIMSDAQITSPTSFCIMPDT